MKIWSGSAASEGDNSAYDFMVKKDINVDAYLVRYEALHLLMYNFYLYNHGIIKKEDAKKIFIALIKAYEDGIKLNESLEDVHGNMEYYIIENAGEAGRNLRMFMSRNEQVHTDFNFLQWKLYYHSRKAFLKL
ncbi:hypothetical protein [Acidiplasma cupricumulans]|uniref:hypothetical protein n=1 Tax=Acidiplasma cupricumulans TaxID=312540 RepID=UPI0007850039|nr:hypothetical protein [Acidiplasma cupricumulans]